MSGPCLCGDPGCSRCGNPPSTRLYANADHCPHPEPAPGTDAWDTWYDDHPESHTPDVENICLMSPLEDPR